MKKIIMQREFIKSNEEWYQLFGKEATEWFGKNCHWIPWKYTRSEVETAWSIATKNSDRDFRHFMQNLK